LLCFSAFASYGDSCHLQTNLQPLSPSVRTNTAPALTGSNFVGRSTQAAEGRKHLALAEFCRTYEIVELWFDRGPNDQLQLIWLLDHLSSDPEIAPKLRLRLVEFDLLSADGEGIGNSKSYVLAVDVTGYEFEAARAAWQAYRATTPERCFDLVHTDLSALPFLTPALLDLLQELPSRTTGLGTTEMRLLALISRGYASTNWLFSFLGLGPRSVFNSWEIGSLLKGLAHGPNPAVAGLDDELRTLRGAATRPTSEAICR
jgi:hypothetical protein